MPQRTITVNTEDISGADPSAAITLTVGLNQHCVVVDEVGGGATEVLFPVAKTVELTNGAGTITVWDSNDLRPVAPNTQRPQYEISLTAQGWEGCSYTGYVTGNTSLSQLLVAGSTAPGNIPPDRELPPYTATDIGRFLRVATATTLEWAVVSGGGVGRTDAQVGEAAFKNAPTNLTAAEKEAVTDAIDAVRLDQLTGVDKRWYSNHSTATVFGTQTDRRGSFTITSGTSGAPTFDGASNVEPNDVATTAGTTYTIAVGAGQFTEGGENYRTVPTTELAELKSFTAFDPPNAGQTLVFTNLTAWTPVGTGNAAYYYAQATIVKTGTWPTGIVVRAADAQPTGLRIVISQGDVYGLSDAAIGRKAARNPDTALSDAQKTAFRNAIGAVVFTDAQIGEKAALNVPTNLTDPQKKNVTDRIGALTEADLLPSTTDFWGSLDVAGYSNDTLWAGDRTSYFAIYDGTTAPDSRIQYGSTSKPFIDDTTVVLAVASQMRAVNIDGAGVQTNRTIADAEITNGDILYLRSNRNSNSGSNYIKLTITGTPTTVGTGTAAYKWVPASMDVVGTVTTDDLITVHFSDQLPSAVVAALGHGISNPTTIGRIAFQNPPANLTDGEKSSVRTAIGAGSGGGGTTLPVFSTADANEVVQINSGGTGYEYGKIEGANVADKAIDTAQIADDAIEAAQIADGAVGRVALASTQQLPATLGTAGQVLKVNSGATALEYAADNTGTGGTTLPTFSTSDANEVLQINNAGTGYEYDLVQTANVADNAITAAKIATGAVGASEIASGAVDTAELADDAVTAAKIDDGAVGRVALASTQQMPAALGTAGQVLKINSGATAAEWAADAGGATTFLGLTDTPGSYGTAGQIVRINSAGDALEFVTSTGGGAISLNQVTQGTSLSLDRPGFGTNARTGSVAHGLGGEPDFIRMTAECKVADRGYSVGDTIDYGTGLAGEATAVYFDSTNIYLGIRSVGMWMSNKAATGTARMNTQSWEFTITPYKYTAGTSTNLTDAQFGDKAWSNPPSDLTNTEKTAGRSAIGAGTSNVSASSDLSDVPALGTAGQILAVNSGATALEYVAAPSGGGGTTLPAFTTSDANEVVQLNSGGTAYEYGLVDTANLADDAVTAAKIADGAVNADRLASNAVTNAKMADNAVGTSEIADNAVTAAKIASGAVDTAELADDAVTAAKIDNGAVGRAALASTQQMPATLGTAGQVLKVNSGATATEWAADNTGGGGTALPSVTTSDNDDVLGVVSGAWAKADLGDLLSANPPESATDTEKAAWRTAIEAGPEVDKSDLSALFPGGASSTKPPTARAVAEALRREEGFLKNQRVLWRASEDNTDPTVAQFFRARYFPLIRQASDLTAPYSTSDEELTLSGASTDDRAIDVHMKDDPTYGPDNFGTEYLARWATGNYGWLTYFASGTSTDGPPVASTNETQLTRGVGIFALTDTANEITFEAKRLDGTVNDASITEAAIHRAGSALGTSSVAIGQSGIASIQRSGAEVTVTMQANHGIGFTSAVSPVLFTWVGLNNTLKLYLNGIEVCEWIYSSTFWPFRRATTGNRDYVAANKVGTHYGILTNNDASATGLRIKSFELGATVNRPEVYDNSIEPRDLDSTAAGTANQFLKLNSTADQFEWVANPVPSDSDIGDKAFSNPPSDLTNTEQTAARSAIGAGTSSVSASSDLSDVPALGTAGQILAVNSGATALEYIAAPSGGGGTTLPAFTTSDANEVLQLNSGGTAYEYGLVDTANLANDAVTAAKIDDGAVGSAALASNAVTNAKMADNAVNTSEIANNAVTAAKIAANAVGSSEIASGAVDTSELADDAVTAAKIDDGAVGRVALASSQQMPASLGTAGQVLKVNSGATAAEWGTDAGGSTTFAGLTDTPSSLGTAGQVPVMNSAANALEWSNNVLTGGVNQVVQGTAQTMPRPGISGNARTATWNHGLGGVPDFLSIQATCQVADRGFAVGDVIDYTTVGGESFTPYWTATQVGVAFRTLNGDTGMWTTSKDGTTTARIDFSDWDWTFTPYRYQAGTATVLSDAQVGDKAWSNPPSDLTSTEQTAGRSAIGAGTSNVSASSDLSDVPALGTAGQILQVNSGATALEYGTLPTELPSVSTSDNGDVLSVVSGSWAKSDPPSITNIALTPSSLGTAGQILAVNSGATALEYIAAPSGGGTSLPTVTAADNGDVLTVVSGAWAKADPPGGALAGLKLAGTSGTLTTAFQTVTLTGVNADTWLMVQVEKSSTTDCITYFFRVGALSNSTPCNFGNTPAGNSVAIQRTGTAGVQIRSTGALHLSGTWYDATARFYIIGSPATTKVATSAAVTTTAAATTITGVATTDKITLDLKGSNSVESYSTLFGDLPTTSATAIKIGYRGTNDYVEVFRTGTASITFTKGSGSHWNSATVAIIKD